MHLTGEENGASDAGKAPPVFVEQEDGGWRELSDKGVFRRSRRRLTRHKRCDWRLRLQGSTSLSPTLKITLPTLNPDGSRLDASAQPYTLKPGPSTPQILVYHVLMHPPNRKNLQP